MSFLVSRYSQTKLSESTSCNTASETSIRSQNEPRQENTSKKEKLSKKFFEYLYLELKMKIVLVRVLREKTAGLTQIPLEV